LECISKVTGSWRSDKVEREGRIPIMNTPLHLAWYLKGILGTEWFQLEECRKMVRYDGIPGHDEPHKLRGSLNAS
jgi:hypothetical protein